MRYSRFSCRTILFSLTAGLAAASGCVEKQRSDPTEHMRTFVANSEARETAAKAKSALDEQRKQQMVAASIAACDRGDDSVCEKLVLKACGSDAPSRINYPPAVLAMLRFNATENCKRSVRCAPRLARCPGASDAAKAAPGR